MKNVSPCRIVKLQGNRRPDAEKELWIRIRGISSAEYKRAMTNPQLSQLQRNQLAVIRETCWLSI